MHLVTLQDEHCSNAMACPHFMVRCSHDSNRMNDTTSSSYLGAYVATIGVSCRGYSWGNNRYRSEYVVKAGRTHEWDDAMEARVGGCQCVEPVPKDGLDEKECFFQDMCRKYGWSAHSRARCHQLQSESESESDSDSESHSTTNRTGRPEACRALMKGISPSP